MSEKIEVIKSASAPSLSGKGTIGYEIGAMEDKQYIRLCGNSGGGFFSKEWILWVDVQKLLTGMENITSKGFSPLYKGRSSNSPGFLLACVLHENSAVGVSTKKPAKENKGRKDEAIS